VFSKAERAALAWAGPVTRVVVSGMLDSAYNAAPEGFDEKQLVELAIAISLINSYNRMAISFGDTPGRSRKLTSYVNAPNRHSHYRSPNIIVACSRGGCNKPAGVTDVPAREAGWSRL
jgi:hypothetical protein